MYLYALFLFTFIINSPAEAGPKYITDYDYKTFQSVAHLCDLADDPNSHYRSLLVNEGWTIETLTFPSPKDIVGVRARNGSLTVIAYSETKDWTTFFKADHYDINRPAAQMFPVCGSNFFGHQGFLDFYESIGACNRASTLYNPENDGETFIFTGYGLGGTLAQIGFVDIFNAHVKDFHSKNDISIVTFGSPSIFVESTRNFMQSFMPGFSNIRIVYSNDHFAGVTRQSLQELLRLNNLEDAEENSEFTCLGYEVELIGDRDIPHSLAKYIEAVERREPAIVSLWGNPFRSHWDFMWDGLFGTEATTLTFPEAYDKEAILSLFRRALSYPKARTKVKTISLPNLLDAELSEVLFNGFSQFLELTTLQSDHPIGDEVAKELSKFIAINPSLMFLNIQNRETSKESLQLIFDGLATNTKLSKIFIGAGIGHEKANLAVRTLEKYQHLEPSLFSDSFLYGLGETDLFERLRILARQRRDLNAKNNKEAT